MWGLGTELLQFIRVLGTYPSVSLSPKVNCAWIPRESAQYREMAVLLWRGFTYDQVMAQCFGNYEDTGTKGRQMPVVSNFLWHRVLPTYPIVHHPWWCFRRESWGWRSINLFVRWLAFRFKSFAFPYYFITFGYTNPTSGRRSLRSETRSFEKREELRGGLLRGRSSFGRRLPCWDAVGYVFDFLFDRWMLALYMLFVYILHWNAPPRSLTAVSESLNWDWIT